jgi:hypothetical protein
LRYVTTHHPHVDFDGTPLSAAASLGLPTATNQTSQALKGSGGGQTPIPGGTGQSGALAGQPATSAPTPVPAGDAGQANSSSRDKEKEKDKDKDGPSDPPPKPPLSPTWTPLDPEPFELDIQELSADLITKTKQIEGLLRGLPRDLPGAEKKQRERIAELVGELEELEIEVKKARDTKDHLLSRVEGIICGIGIVGNQGDKIVTGGDER